MGNWWAVYNYLPWHCLLLTNSRSPINSVWSPGRNTVAETTPAYSTTQPPLRKKPVEKWAGSFVFVSPIQPSVYEEKLYRTITKVKHQLQAPTRFIKEKRNFDPFPLILDGRYIQQVNFFWKCVLGTCAERAWTRRDGDQNSADGFVTRLMG